jgi:hypothetical protein
MNQLIWRYTGQSVTGTSHERAGLPCQDAHRIEIINDILIAVVADGAGSAKYADKAAQLVTEQAILSVKEICTKVSRTHDAHGTFDQAEWQKQLEGLIAFLRIRLEEKAQELTCQLRDLATTFLLAIVLPEGIIGLQIGDGGIVCSLENDLTLLTAPSCGEYINETTFLISENFAKDIQFACREGNLDRLALFSDGLQLLSLDLMTHPPHPYLPFFQPLFNFLEKVDNDDERRQQLHDFLASPRVCSRTDDDKTLIIAIKKNIG